MHRSRKSIVTVAAALAGVLAMAGVAAAEHGGAARALHSSPNRHRGHGLAATSTTGKTGKTSTSGDVGGMTTTEPEHATPEPGDDNGGLAPGEPTTTTGTVAPGREHDAAGPGDDTAGHDAADDNGGDETTTTMTGTTMPTDTSTTLPDETSTTVATIPNGTQTFTVAGGTVTVDVENGVLSLVSATPSDGFVVKDQESRSDRVEVDFRGGDTESRVRVRIEDGQLRVETEDN